MTENPGKTVRSLVAEENAALREQLALLKSRPRVGVGVAVLTPQGYVLLKRRNAHGAGTWSFPGGHLEFGESVVDCAIRETREEIGITLRDPELLPVITEDHFPEEGLQYITLYVRGWTDEEPRILEPEKSDALISCRPEDFPDPLFCGIRQVAQGGHLKMHP